MNEFSVAAIAKKFTYLAAGQYGGLVCNMAFSVWLTRLLTPHDFGLVAVSLFYFTFFNWIAEWGWDAAFMMHKELPKVVSAGNHLGIRASLGFMPFFVFLLGYTVLLPRLGITAYGVLVLLAVVYWIERIGTTYKIILEREYLLEKIAVIEFVVVFSSYVTAVAAALSGAGVYSLVLQRFIEKGGMTLGYYYNLPWKFRISFDKEIIQAFFKTTGIATWLSGVFGLALYDFMPFLIGALATVDQAGLYAKAFNLATFPVMLTGICARITTPFYTQYQFDGESIKRVFVRCQTIKLCIIVPIQLLLFATAPWWIMALLGPGWRALVPVYRLMAVYGFFRAFYDDVPNVLTYGFKNVWPLAYNQVFQSMLILVIGPLAVSHFSALGGAGAMSVMMISGAVMFWRTVLRVLDCGIQDFVTCFVRMPAWVWGRLVGLAHEE